MFSPTSFPARYVSVFGMFACLLLGACGTGGGGTGPAPDAVVCASGNRCLCETTTDTCKKTCDAGSCKLYCAGTGTCDFTCDGGKCEILLTGSVTTNISCKGGGCSVTNTSTGELTMDCPGNDCKMLCGAKDQSCKMTGCSSGCELSCYPLNENCSNSCTDPTCK